MNGRQRIEALFQSGNVDRIPALPILHTGLAPLSGGRLRDYFTSAEAMSGLLIEGWRRFGYDGVQMTQGVTGEAQALGARVEYPENAAPVLREHLLAGSMERLCELRKIALEKEGGMPMFFDAVQRTVAEIGEEAFVLVTLRGPLLIAAQLRGIEPMMMDLLVNPDLADAILCFSAETAVRAGRYLAAAGAHGILMGEAVCSPDFISPRLYRERIAPLHKQVIREWRSAGWRRIGLHICGNIPPIIPDILSTGADFFDVDSAVCPREAARLVQGRAVLRGNINPAAVFRFGSAAAVRSATEAFLRESAGGRWIAGSGCDIPPGTPPENIAAFMDVIKASGGSPPCPRL